MCRVITIIMLSVRKELRPRESSDFPKMAELTAEAGFGSSSAQPSPVLSLTHTEVPVPFGTIKSGLLPWVGVRLQ